VDLQPVQRAYSAMSAQYIEMFGGGWQDHEDDIALVRRHLTGLRGPVLDLGCGPGHWSAYLHSSGARVTGVDLVPEFIAHARATHPGPQFQLGSMTELDLPEQSVAGILSWYSTIHLPPEELDRVLAGFHRLLQPSGMLVIGFFDSSDGVSGFDHKVVTAYRWPVNTFRQVLETSGFTEVERLQHEIPERPDRKYAAIAARAT
jgi:SAM-dependent methyltransferase